MRIGMYVEVALDERPTGIGKHIQCLLDALAEIDDRNEYFLYYPTPLWRARIEFPHRPSRANFRARPVRAPGPLHHSHPRLWWNHYLPRVLRRDKIDVFHGPNHFLPTFPRNQNIVTIHDLAYFHMPVHGEHMDSILRQWTMLSLKQAGAVIALSENTKRDVEQLGVPAEQIHVIYGGGNIVPEDRIQHERLAELRERLSLPERFILFVGAIQPRKNIPFLVRAFAELKSRRPDLPHHLVLAGPLDSAADEVRALAEQLGLGHQVRMTGYLEDWQIPLLYKAADLFALPTRYEGFTLVTLEAMGYGTPLVATDSSSIKEGVGDAALLVGVDDVKALADAMERGITDAALREELTQKGKKQAAKFTWRNCAQQTLQLYNLMRDCNRLQRRKAVREAFAH